jgi:hypothetical protein
MWLGALVFTLIASDLYNRFIDEPIRSASSGSISRGLSGL